MCSCVCGGWGGGEVIDQRPSYWLQHSLNQSSSYWVFSIPNPIKRLEKREREVEGN